MTSCLESECLEYQSIHRFFEEQHLIIRRQEGEERMRFLKPPSWHGGGRVPKEALYRPDNIKLLSIELIPAVDLIYAALERVTSLAKTKYDEHVGLRLIPKVLHACERRGISQNFVPGILLLYVEHCEGCPWRPLALPMLKEKQKALARMEAMKVEVDRFREEGNFLLSQRYEEEAKLQPMDWPGFMVESFEEFARVMKL